MRIHLNLPQAGPSNPSSSSSSSVRSSAPAPLTTLTPNGELILIELQGALEIKNQSPAGGQILGTISFEPTRPDRPVLMISHHRLEGKFVNLVKPLAVLEKKVRADKTVLSDVGNAKRSVEGDEAEGEMVGNVKRARRVGDDGERRSPPPAMQGVRKGRDSMDFSSSPPRPTPVSRVGKKSDRLRDIDENGVPVDRSDAETTEGDKDNEDEEQEEDQVEPQTAVYYDVVNVIKRKILFSKRPEPIVRLDSTSTTITKA